MCQRGQLPPCVCHATGALPCRANVDGLERMSGRVSRRRETPNPSSCRRCHSGTVDLGKAGCLAPRQQLTLKQMTHHDDHISTPTPQEAFKPLPLTPRVPLPSPSSAAHR